MRGQDNIERKNQRKPFLVFVEGVNERKDSSLFPAFLFNNLENIFDIVISNPFAHPSSISNPHFKFKTAFFVIGGQVRDEISWEEFVKNRESKKHKWDIFFNKVPRFVSLFEERFHMYRFAYFPCAYHEFTLLIDFDTFEQETEFLKMVEMGIIKVGAMTSDSIAIFKEKMNDPMISPENFTDVPSMKRDLEDFVHNFKVKSLDKAQKFHNGSEYLNNLFHQTVMIKTPVQIPGLKFFDRHSQKELFEFLDEKGCYTYSLLPLKNGQFPIHSLNIYDVNHHRCALIVPLLDGKVMEDISCFKQFQFFYFNFHIYDNGLFLSNYCY